MEPIQKLDQDTQGRIHPVDLNRYADLGLVKPVDFRVGTIEEFHEDLGRIFPRETGATYLPRMTASRLAISLTLEIINDLNVSVLVQVIGSFTGEPRISHTHYDIGRDIGINTSDRAAFGVALPGSWFPFHGLVITPASAPASGSLRVWAHGQRRLS